MKKAKRIGGLFALALALVLTACGGVGSGAADSASPRVEQWNAGSNTDSMFQESVGISWAWTRIYQHGRG